MAGVSENYGLAVDVATDNFIEPDHHNRMAATVDRVLGNLSKKMVAQGAHSGWGLTLTGTVTAGEGLVGGCWCKTAAEQGIGELTAGASNYVFGRAAAEAAADGGIQFFAQISATKPAGAVLLGTVEVNAQGLITAVDEDPAGVDRNCLRLEIGRVSGNGMVTGVPAGGEFTAQVSHGEVFLVPGAIQIGGSEGFTWELAETYRGDGFLVKGTNGGASEADFVYSWVRRGLIG